MAASTASSASVQWQSLRSALRIREGVSLNLDCHSSLRQKAYRSLLELVSPAPTSRIPVGMPYFRCICLFAPLPLTSSSCLGSGSITYLIHFQPHFAPRCWLSFAPSMFSVFSSSQHEQFDRLTCCLCIRIGFDVAQDSMMGRAHSVLRYCHLDVHSTSSVTLKACPNQ